jgi:hypothetical protein
MWICPRCSEVHEDHFKVCWKCAGDEMKSSDQFSAEPLPPGEKRCSQCGQLTTSYAGICWLCLENLPSEVQQAERTLRPLSWVLRRAAVAFVLGMTFGFAAAHRITPAGDNWLTGALVLGLIVGVVLAFVVGVFVWVVFPYEPSQASGLRNQGSANR